MKIIVVLLISKHEDYSRIAALRESIKHNNYMGKERK